MKAIQGVWRNGQIVPAQPVDWPDGTVLSIEPLEDFQANDLESDLLGDDVASIARRIAYYEALPPLRMLPEEEAEWQAARREMRDYTIAKTQARPLEDCP